MYPRLQALFLVFLFFACFLSQACRSGNQTATPAQASPDTVITTAHPSWSYQSTIYEVNLRQFTSEGTFTAFERSLPRIAAMGVGILWFMPINPIGLEGRKSTPKDLGSYYSVKDYNAVNPEYGTMEQWIALVKKAQSLGLKVIMDWVPNHTSPDNPWIKAHPDFYKKDSLGKPAIPFDWTDTRQLDYSNRELRDSMIAAMQFWIKQTGIDGFRCDVAWNVPDDFWKEAIASLRMTKTIFMLAEGDKPSLNKDGFDATYPWNVLNVAYKIYSGKATVEQLETVIDSNDRVFPSDAFRLFFTSNHDENSWNGTEFERFGEGYKAFAVWTFTMGQSIPLIYGGQEEPNKKRLKFFVKDTIAWSKYSLDSFYRSLIAIRRSYKALSSDAGYSKVNTSADKVVFAYKREKDGDRILVLLNLSGRTQQFSLQDSALQGNLRDVFTQVSTKFDSRRIFTLHPWQYLVYDAMK